jgi:chromate transporter
MRHAGFREHWRDIARSLLKLGATAYGGPAIIGVMQAELQERRQWVPKARFVEGLSLANLLPGATATQLGIFLGYARGGWWGGVLGGLSFVLPGFAIMLALTLAYAALGVTPIMRGALYGLGPVVLGIYAVAVYRLGRSTLETGSQGILAVAAAIAALWGPVGPAAILLLGGGTGLLLFHSRRLGAAVLLSLTAALIAWPYAARSMPAVLALPPDSSRPAGLFELGALLFTIGAFTFGGGLSMIALIQDQMVQQLHWLTPQQFLDGLALGQLTPGPILMVAAYVGYTMAGLTGAVVGAAAAFLPSFVLMLALLPVFDRVRALGWARAALRGIGPAVIGVLAVSLVHLAPHALVDPFAVVLLGATVIALVYWRVASLKLMLAGSVLGVLRGRLAALHAVRSLLSVSRL